MRYHYKALTPTGELRTGWRTAPDIAALEQQLQHNHLELLRARKKFFNLQRKPNRAQKIIFFSSLAQFTRSGVPLLDGLSDLADGMNDPHWRDIVASLAHAIENGSRLSQALAQHPAAFDASLVGLAQAGEESGHLPETFERIAEMLKWQDELAAQTRSMLLYPAFTGVTVTAVTLFLLVYLVPQLAGFIRQVGGTELPFYTRWLLAVSNWLVHYWYVVPLVPLLVFSALSLALKYHAGFRRRIDRLTLSAPPVGPILRKIVLARFVHAFAMMYESGIGVPDCLAHARGITRNTVVADGITRALRDIEAGGNLTQSFRAADLFPPLALRMIAVGETTGRLNAALRDIGYFYDRDAKEAVRRLQTLAEPVMTLLLGLVLGWVMLSVLSPIYDLVGRMKT
jgi:type IV pilus assembly protein PilC